MFIVLVDLNVSIYNVDLTCLSYVYLLIIDTTHTHTHTRVYQCHVHYTVSYIHIVQNVTIDTHKRTERTHGAIGCTQYIPPPPNVNSIYQVSVDVDQHNVLPPTITWHL